MVTRNHEFTNQELVEAVDENPDSTWLETMLVIRLSLALKEIEELKMTLAGYAGS